MINLADIPAELAAQAIVLAGEPAWPPDAARRVIEYLRQSGVAVLGIEMWLPEGGSPRVLTSWCSRYNVAFTGDWHAYVEENAREALADISSAEQSGELPPEVLVNLTGTSREEWESLR